MSLIDRIERYLTNLQSLSMQIWGGWEGEGYMCTAVESTRKDAGRNTSVGKKEWSSPGVSLAF